MQDFVGKIQMTHVINGIQGPDKNTPKANKPILCKARVPTVSEREGKARKYGPPATHRFRNKEGKHREDVPPAAAARSFTVSNSP
jgi:hypothetical protein